MLGHTDERRPWFAKRIDSSLVVGATLFAVALAVAWYRQRFEVITFGVAIVGFLQVARSNQRWTRHRSQAIAIGLSGLVVFVYLWTLGEAEHIEVRVTPGRYDAKIGDTTAVVRPTTHGSGFGFYSGSTGSYRVLLAGEATFDPNSSILARFGAWVRGAAPRPAWTNVRIVSGAGSQDVLAARHPKIIAGSWSFDARGEFEGRPLSSILLTSVSTRSYTIEADLMRGDGAQGILVGLDRAGNGDVLVARIDQPDALWVTFDNGVPTTGLSGTGVKLPLIPSVQRDLRLLLSNVMVGMFLLIAAFPFYAVVSLILGRTSEDVYLDRFAAKIFRVRTFDTFALALAIATTVATGLIATRLLEGIPHVQDSVAYMFQAKTLASGHLWVPVPRLPQFFTEEFIPMYHGRWFAQYPPGWPVLLAMGVLIHQPWAVNPVLAGIDVGIIYLLGREVYSPLVGAIAAALALSSPFLLFLGGSFMAHTSTLFYLSSSAYLLTRWLKRQEAGRTNARLSRVLLISAGFLAGMGAITRQLDAVSLAVPFTIALCPALWRAKFVPLKWLALGGALPILAFLFYNWNLMGAPFSSPYAAWGPNYKVGFGPDIGQGGFTVAQGFANMSVNLEMLLAHLFGWPFFFTMALAAIPFISGGATRWDWLFLGGALMPILAYVAYWSPGIMYGPRYLYVTIPFFALLSARGLQELYDLPIRHTIFGKRDRFSALIFPLVLFSGLLLYDLRVYLPAQVPMYRGYNSTSRASLDAVEKAHIHHALVFVVDNPPNVWWAYGAVFPANSPTLDGDIVYAHDLGRDDKKLSRLYPSRATYRVEGAVVTKLNP